MAVITEQYKHYFECWMYQNLRSRFGIERLTHTERCIHQFSYVCVYDYSSQTAWPICIKITLVDRTYRDDCYRLVRFELFTTYSLKFIQKA